MVEDLDHLLKIFSKDEELVSVKISPSKFYILQCTNGSLVSESHRDTSFCRHPATMCRAQNKNMIWLAILETLITDGYAIGNVQ